MTSARGRAKRIVGPASGLRAVEKPRWAALEVRRLRRPGACASQRPKCSSRSIAVSNNSLIAARCSMPWLLHCNWGSLMCAGTASFLVAVLGSQLRAARRRSHVHCESRRMSGSREEWRISKSNGRVAPGPSGLHERGGIRGAVENGRRQVLNDVVLSSGRVGSGPGGWGGARSGQ